MHFANFSTEGDGVTPLHTVYTGCAAFWCDQTLNSECSDCDSRQSGSYGVQMAGIALWPHTSAYVF